MKKLEDLKMELLKDIVNKFYVFYGEDFGIRHHYIERIKTYFDSKPLYINSYSDLKSANKTQTLFGPSKQLVVIYNDEEFLKLNTNQIQKFIDGLKTYYCIFEYESIPESSTLYKEFGQYVTYFPIVEDNIAKEFVDSELTLNGKFAESLAYNCENAYNDILLESDKIKSYADEKKISQQNAYESLYSKNQMIERIDDFNIQSFMNDVLCYTNNNFDYWYMVINNNIDQFVMNLYYIFSDFVIAGLLKYFGRWNGSNEAYKYRFMWGRIKQIRDLPLVYSGDEYFEMASKIADLDRSLKNGRVQRDNLIDYFFSVIVKKPEIEE